MLIPLFQWVSGAAVLRATTFGSFPWGMRVRVAFAGLVCFGCLAGWHLGCVHCALRVSTSGSFPAGSCTVGHGRDSF